jgi:cytochrome P450
MESAQFDSVTLAAEAAMALIAGSGGISATMLNTVFYLLAHPPVLQKLRAELDAAVEPGTVEIEHGVLAQLPYLRAVLYVSCVATV